jgi:hypothetical protein
VESTPQSQRKSVECGCFVAVLMALLLLGPLLTGGQPNLGLLGFLAVAFHLVAQPMAEMLRRVEALEAELARLRTDGSASDRGA